VERKASPVEMRVRGDEKLVGHGLCALRQDAG